MDSLAQAQDLSLRTNTLSKQSIYHLWGIFLQRLSHAVLGESLYRQFDLQSQSWGSFPLAWHHTKEAKRRPGLPSWSPLGWTGEMIFGQSEYLVSPCGVFAVTPAGKEALGSFIPTYDTTPPEVSSEARDARPHLCLTSAQWQSHCYSAVRWRPHCIAYQLGPKLVAGSSSWVNRQILIVYNLNDNPRGLFAAKTL